MQSGHPVMWMESLYLNNEERIGKELWAHTVGEFLILEIVRRLNRQELKIIRTYKTGRDPSCRLNQSFPTSGQSAHRWIVSGLQVSHCIGPLILQDN